MARALVKTVGFEVGELKTSSASSLSGWIVCDGKSIGKTGADFNGDDYRSLYDLLWSMDGLSTTATEPFVISSAKGASAQADWDANKTIAVDFATNGYFIRQKKSGRDLGSNEDDAIQGHHHNIDAGLTAASGSARQCVSNSGNSPVPGTAVDLITDGVNGTPRTASETRSKNVALNYFIKY